MLVLDEGSPGLRLDESSKVSLVVLGQVRIGLEDVRVDVMPHGVLVVPGGHRAAHVEVHEESAPEPPPGLGMSEGGVGAVVHHVEERKRLAEAKDDREEESGEEGERQRSEGEEVGEQSNGHHDGHAEESSDRRLRIKLLPLEVVANSLAEVFIEPLVANVGREFVGGDGANLVLGQHFMRLVGEWVVGLEGLRDVPPGRQTKDLLPSRMTVHPGGDVIDLVVNSNPAICLSVMLRHFFPSKVPHALANCRHIIFVHIRFVGRSTGRFRGLGKGRHGRGVYWEWGEGEMFER